MVVVEQWMIQILRAGDVYFPNSQTITHGRKTMIIELRVTCWVNPVFVDVGVQRGEIHVSDSLSWRCFEIQLG